MSGRASRSKGANAERELVQILREHGYDVHRSPHSGALEWLPGEVRMTDDTTPLKRCSKCGQERPATAEHFRLSKHSGLPVSPCRVCRSEACRLWRQANAEHVAKKSVEWRVANIDKKRCIDKRYREAHPEAVKAGVRKWFAEHAEHVREKNQRWAAEHPEEVKAYKRAWAKRNPESVRLNVKVRSARRRSAEGNHTAADIRAQYARQRGRCFWCKAQVDEVFHVDHVTPLALGGTNGPENIVISCPECNHKKSAKHPMDWSGQLL